MGTMASEFETYHGYAVTFYVEAIADHPASDFGAFSQLVCNAQPGSVLTFIVPDAGHCDAVPRLWLGDVVSHRGLSNWAFEIRSVVPERMTVEALLDAIAAELEPHGWGLSNYPRGAIAKQEQARAKLRMENVGKIGNLGKPMY
jgi:hypothetical protein